MNSALLPRILLRAHFLGFQGGAASFLPLRLRSREAGRSLVFLASLLLLCSVAFGQYTGPASQLVYKNGANYERKDMTTGGTTSNGSAAVIINGAIGALTNGGTVHLLGNTTYVLTDYIAMGNKVTLQGEGAGTVLSLSGTNAENAIIVVRGKTEWTIRDLKLTQSDYLTQAVDIRSILVIQLNTTTYAESGLIENIVAENITGDGLLMYEGVRNVIARNVRVKNSKRGSGVKVFPGSAANKSLDNIILDEINVNGCLSHGIHIGVAYGKNIILKGAVVENALNGSTYIAGVYLATFDFVGVHVSDVTVKGNWVGVYLNAVSGASLSNINAVSNSADGFYVRDSTECSFSNITVVDNGTSAPTGTYDGFKMIKIGSVDNSRHLLNNVRAKNVDTTNQRYGVLGQGSNHCVVNHDTGGRTAAYSFPAAQNNKVDTVVQ